ncbi:MAG: acyl dehydratase [Actinobacteria bacterium]|nr:acyl dehydratase [Actinomycetota bacterium]
MSTFGDSDPLEDQRRYAVITDDAVDALRRLIGVPITETVEPWCHEVTRDSVRHYAHGIGDDNPLWCDPAYAAAGPHGGIVAPPSFIFPLNRVLSGYVGGLPGIHAMWAGANLTWHDWFRRGDEISTVAYLKDLIPHDTRFAGRAIQQIYHAEFRNQDGRLIAEGDSWCFRIERDTARELGTKYDSVKDREPRMYTDAELEQIWDLYRNEQVRGAEARYVEDVQVGDELPPIVKGPMTATGFIAYAQGWGGLYIRANKLAWKQLEKHPGLGLANAMGIPDVPERVHWENDLATDVGTPAAYDYGPERCSWLTHHVTNWMGDAGFLVEHRSEIRRHNPVGDWMVVRGKVTAITKGADGSPLVEIAQQARQQDDELSATGRAFVRLPSRG